MFRPCLLKLFMLFLLAFSLAACDKDSSSNSSASEPAPVSDLEQYCEFTENSPHDFPTNMDPSLNMSSTHYADKYTCVYEGYTCRIYFASLLYTYDTCDDLIEYSLDDLL